ncbi:MAG: hypothetical protein ACF8NJ_01240 [Phycisphaerales bacterium JB038]
MPTSTNKQPSRRVVYDKVWEDAEWRVVDGELVRSRGRPGRVKPLFRVVAEKLPYDSLGAVAAHMKACGLERDGVYLAHDSMGVVRYAGRGNVFARLRARRRAAWHELVYYSFYIVADKIHEREIETIIIRAAGPLLHFNDRKKRVDITPGAIRDYEPGTMFYARRINGKGKVYDED